MSSDSQEVELARRQYLNQITSLDLVVVPESQAAKCIDLRYEMLREAREPDLFQTKTLFHDTSLALCRTDFTLYCLRRDKAENWRVGCVARLPEDWVQDATHGFSTYVTDSVVRQVFDQLRAACRMNDSEGIHSRLSNKSPLAARMPDNAFGRIFPTESRHAVELHPNCDDSNEVKSFKLLAVEGRYAVALVNARHATLLTLSSGSWNVRNSDFLVIFRADDGINWKAFSTLDVYGISTIE